MKKRNQKWTYGVAIVLVLFIVGSVIFYFFSNRYSDVIRYVHGFNETAEISTS